MANISKLIEEVEIEVGRGEFGRAIEYLKQSSEKFKQGYREEGMKMLKAIDPKAMAAIIKASELWEEANPAEKYLLELSKYKIRVGKEIYFADHVTLDNGYVRFVPVGKTDGATYYVPKESLKEMWVRADVIEDPVFTAGADLTEILLALVPIAAMFLLPRVLR